MEFSPDSESAMLALGARLAAAIPNGGTIFLSGDLGAGKTTLARGILRGLGHHGPVRSPTFTLVEPYEIAARQVFHFDLYRLADPGELEYLGARDFFGGEALCLIEWPERGGGWLPAPDLLITIRGADTGRIVAVSAGSGHGQQILGRLEAR